MSRFRLYRMLWIAVVTTMIILVPQATLAATLEAYLSAPFAYALTGSSAGDALAWITDVRGVRNVYFWDGHSARAVTQFLDDDGIELSSLAFVPKTHVLVFVRGGAGDNGGGDNPNPARFVDSPARTIYTVDADAAAPPKVFATGNYPKPSPDGKSIAFISGGLNIAPVANGSHTLKVLAGRVINSDYAWSPDSTRIAFTEDHDPAAFIGILDITHSNDANARVQYVSPAFTWDYAPTWSPDGRYVASLRTPASDLDTLLPPDIGNGPWSLQVFDTLTGALQTLYSIHQQGSLGYSFFWPDLPVSGPLWWLATGTLVFPNESDGHLHLYAIDLQNAGRPQLLTPGQYDVEAAWPMLDNRELLIQSNENDLIARHIWRTNPRHAGTVAVTSGPENQWSPVPLVRGIAYVQAGYDVPPQVMVKQGTEKSLTAVAAPAQFLQARFVRPRVVSIFSADHLTIHGELFLPMRPGRHPALIFVHGGYWRQMLAGFHNIEFYAQLYESNQYYVSQGVTVLSIDYRGSTGYGYRFRNAPDIMWTGSREYQDVLAAARWLRSRPDVDSTKIGIYGLSDGGYLTALALARNSDIFKVGADFSGVHDWVTLQSTKFSTRKENALALRSSPIFYVASWRSPVYLAQGSDDRNVPFEQGLRLADALSRTHVEVEQHVYPGEVHEFTVFADLVREYNAAAQFILRHLRP